MIVLRSLAFQLAFYGWTLSMILISLPLLRRQRIETVRQMERWARGNLWLLRHLVGVTWELRGAERLPKGGCIVASKHQSAWDTFVYHLLLDDPAIVLKIELMRLPGYSQYARKVEMIPVDRRGGAKALRATIEAAKRAVGRGQPILIFPEGTRAPPEHGLDYQPGVAALYKFLAVPVVPVALNSGLCWPARALTLRPGKIVVEFQEPIAPGLERDAFMAELKQRIEPATARLVAEARSSAG
ncbi:MAG: 1-acyl-sn-glycerol-3-phosphate acyltransferase [Alphaproteobacteria bacterium]|nr:1-acyl-sn-glycerol-3-phosphate acyltransferase [Alphaproteobacteria bacterium]